MAEPIGSLHAEVTASTLKYREELDRGKRSARSFAKSSNREMGAAKGQINKTTAATKNLGAGITASAGLMRNFGLQALGPMGELGQNFASLAAGAGAFGVALVGVTVLVLDMKEGVKQLRAENEAMSASFEKASKATTRFLEIRKRLASFEAKRRVERTGRSSELLDVEDELRALRGRLEGEQARLDRAKENADRQKQITDRIRKVGSFGGSLGRAAADAAAAAEFFDLTGAREAVNRGEGAVRQLYERIEFLERERTRISAAETSKRVDTERMEWKERIEIAESAQKERERGEEALQSRRNARAIARAKEIQDLTNKNVDAARDAEAALADAIGGASALDIRIRKLEQSRQAELAKARSIGASTEQIERQYEALRQLAFIEDERRQDARLPTIDDALGGYVLDGYNESKGKGASPLRTELTEIEKTSKTLGETFANSFGGAVADSLLKVRDLESALLNIGNLIVSTAIQLGVSAGVGGFFGAVGLPGFGPAAPGKVAALSAPSVGPGKVGALKVDVHNYAGASVGVRETVGPQGPQLDVVIEETVARSIENNGRVGKALARTHGRSRRGRRG